MKYWAPYGITDPDAPYINGDPSIGRQGSIPPAGSIEQDQREIVNTIMGASFVPSETDVHQLLIAVRSQRMNYAVDVNDVANTLSVTFIPPIGNEFLTPGLPIRVKPLISNTGACTMIVDNIEHPLRRANGSELVEGDIINGIPFEAIWNDGGYWAMTNYHGLPGVGPPQPPELHITKIPYTVDVGTPGHIVANFTPPITNPVPGDAIEVKLTNNIIGATGITINGLPEVAVVRPTSGALHSGDGATGQIALMFRSDAGNWQFAAIIPSTFAGFGVPIGSLILTCGNAAPPGTLKLNGVELQRSEHPGLWAFALASGRLVGEAVWQNAANQSWTAFSDGNGVTSFRLPDFRAEFMRFWDDARTVDNGRILGKWQTDSIGSLTSITGTVDLLNPKVQFGPVTTSMGSNLMCENQGELSWSLPRYEWSLQAGGGWPDVSSSTVLPLDPMYNQGDITKGAEIAGGPFLEVGWVMPTSRAHSAYGGGTPPGAPWGFFPTHWQHRESRIIASVQMNLSGGSAETRPRNTAVLACIVDG